MIRKKVIIANVADHILDMLLILFECCRIC